MIALGVAEVVVRIFTPREVAPIGFRFDPDLNNFSQMSIDLKLLFRI
jgi:hypothetical protein